MKLVIYTEYKITIIFLSHLTLQLYIKYILKIFNIFYLEYDFFLKYDISHKQHLIDLKYKNGNL